MPKNRGFCIDPDTRSRNNLIEKINGKRSRMKMNLTVLGESLGTTQQNFGKKLRQGKFDFVELIKIFEKLEFSEEEVIELMMPYRKE